MDKKDDFAINPITGEAMNKKKLVLIFGYSKQNTENIVSKIPSEYQPYVCDCITDLIAVPCVYKFINPDVLSQKDISTLIEVEIADKESVCYG